MSIGGVEEPGAVDEAAWGRLARGCGLGVQLVRSVRTLAARVVECASAVRESAHAEGWHRPVLDDIVDLCKTRARQLE